MKIRGDRFNTYFMAVLGLALALVVVLGAGCQSAEKKKQKQMAMLRVHVEARADSIDDTQWVSIGRSNLAQIKIYKKPILTEEFVEAAAVTNTVGGFLLSIKFNQEGSMLLEQYSAASYGKRFAIFAHFPLDPKSKTNVIRWLAAPKISSRITDGTLVFTPDATREEAENAALGLNNVAREMTKGFVF